MAFLLQANVVLSSLRTYGLLPLLIFICLAVALGVAASARKRLLHIPGYIGMALFAFVASLACGRLAGLQGIRGSPLGVILSILCFLLLSVSAGSVLAIFFFRPPLELN